MIGDGVTRTSLSSTLSISILVTSCHYRKCSFFFFFSFQATAWPASWAILYLLSLLKTELLCKVPPQALLSASSALSLPPRCAHPPSYCSFALRRGQSSLAPHSARPSRPAPLRTAQWRAESPDPLTSQHTCAWHEHSHQSPGLLSATTSPTHHCQSNPKGAYAHATPCSKTSHSPHRLRN